MRRIMLAMVGCLGGVALCRRCPADDAPHPARAAFAALDRDGDGRLSAAEFLLRSGNRNRHVRDLQLFDFDGDQALTWEEFSAVPGLGPAQLRGPLPNPWTAAVDTALTAFDQRYGWSAQPASPVPTSSFTLEFLRSLQLPVTATAFNALQPLADPDRDGRITRDEARRFVELQLGLRDERGRPAQLPNGRVLQTTRFAWLDIDVNGVISPAEYLERLPADGAKNFALADLDRDGNVSRTEHDDPQLTQSWADPLDLFCKADVDLDGRLSPEELRTGTAEWRHGALPLMFPAFDDDGDGRLALAEYRVSPLGNYICGWHAAKTDKNRDQRLSFDEFQYHATTGLLLQRLYFDRLDRDGDGTLAAADFAFQKRRPHSLYRLAADGSAFERLWTDERYPDGGSPEISPDGRCVLFDQYQRNMIVKVTLETGQAEDVLSGLMPTWSPDGTQFAVSDGGVSIVTLDGLARKNFAGGWGAQWSPDGKWIAYTEDGGLWVYDTAVRTRRQVLRKTDHDYTQLYYGMCWSPDSRRVAIKATPQQGNEIILVDMLSAEPRFEILYSTDRAFSHSLAWTPDGRRVVFVMSSAAHSGRAQLHEIDVVEAREATLVPGVDPALTYLDCQFSPDGKWLLMFAE